MLLYDKHLYHEHAQFPMVITSKLILVVLLTDNHICKVKVYLRWHKSQINQMAS